MRRKISIIWLLILLWRYVLKNLREISSHGRENEFCIFGMVWEWQLQRREDLNWWISERAWLSSITMTQFRWLILFLFIIYNIIHLIVQSNLPKPLRTPLLDQDHSKPSAPLTAHHYISPSQHSIKLEWSNQRSRWSNSFRSLGVDSWNQSDKPFPITIHSKPRKID